MPPNIMWAVHIFVLDCAEDLSALVLIKYVMGKNYFVSVLLRVLNKEWMLSFITFSASLDIFTNISSLNTL
jgi:membrane protein implicated in regulation of membrane protease activity